MEFIKNEEKGSSYVSVNTLIQRRNQSYFSGSNKTSPDVNQESKSNGQEINGRQGIERKESESGAGTKQETKVLKQKNDDSTRSSGKPYQYNFFYTHTFTAEEVRKQMVGNILGGIIYFLPNLVKELSGVLTLQSLGQTAKNLGGQTTNYESMLGALGTDLQAEEGLTYSQTTTVTCLMNLSGEPQEVIVETKSYIKKDSPSIKSNEQKTITLTFTVVDGSLHCLEGNGEIKYPSVSALLADIAGAYNNPRYLNQSKIRGDYQK
ncbi:MAG TPA: hypothetical protein DDW50_14815 [Firmicutes bacterium]|jgi:hypothetical protein|nr:hypothetical protein [Bacillota bacterium]